jgi:hypothetical protein
LNFIFPIYIPSLDRILHFREFNILEYKEFQKVLTNQNFNALNSFISILISELCEEEINSEDLGFIERCKIVLVIYSYCVDQDKAFYSYIPEGKVKIDFNVYSILDCFDVDVAEERFDFKDFSIVLSDMNSHYSDELSVYDFLKTIQIGDVEYTHNQLDFELFKLLIESLESSEYKVLENYVKQ